MPVFQTDFLRTLFSITGREKKWVITLAICFGGALLFGHWLAKDAQAMARRHGREAYLVAAREALSDRTVAVFVGSSHVVAGIRPDLFSFPCMNIAGVGFDYSILKRIVERNVDSMPNLKLAVIELDLVPLLMDAVAARHGDFESFYVWGLNREDFISDAQLGSVPVASFLSDTLVPAYRFTSTSVTSQRGDGNHKRAHAATMHVVPGHEPSDVALDGSSEYLLLRTKARIKWLQERFGRGRARVNAQSLGDLVRLFAARGVRVLLLRMPHHAIYWSNTPENWTSVLESVQTRVELDCTVWDYERDPRFEDFDFGDTAHLNSSGAAKLCSLLEDRIRTTLHLTLPGK